jgi:hypothetical protein
MRNAHLVVFVRFLQLALLVAGIAARALHAQRDSLTMEIETRERWMHGRQQSRFTPFGTERDRMIVDSVRGSGRERRLYLKLGNTGFGPDSATITVDSFSRRVDTRLRFATYSRRVSYPGDSAEFIADRSRKSVISERRLWDLVPAVPRGTPRVGLSWSDTIAHSVSDGPFRRSLRGTRVSRIIRDTVVDGRRLWIVRDSAIVRYEEGYIEKERTLDTTVQITRTASGTVRGVHALDGQLPLFRWRRDTTRLRGEAVLRYPDGRSFRTPAIFEQMRHWRLFDAQSHERYLADGRAAQARASGGMVLVPSNALERRLSEGDVPARDSLLRQWRRTLDPDSATRIMTLLSRWSRGAGLESLDKIRIAAGDTVHLYQYLARRAYSTNPPVDTADVRAMLRFMEGPSLAWSFNLSRDLLHENLAQAMTVWPRAAAESKDDPVACTLSACQLLAAQMQSTRDPRLRDVALIAHFSMDPRRWADTVLKLDLRAHPVLRPAKLLAVGAGATWIAASKAPMPPANSDARVWLEWMNGVDPQYAASIAGQPFARPVGATPEPRFEASHRTAIRMYTARTGRDIVGELQRSYRAATSDSSRLIFGVMLQGLGALQLTEAEIADAFASGERTRIEPARGALIANMRRSGTPMATAKAAPLIDRLIAAVVNATPLWRNAGKDTRQTRSSVVPGLHGGSGRIFFESDNVPQSIREKWAGRVEFISKSEWNRREPREGGAFYSPSPVITWGRFARVELELSERISRTAGSAPVAYAAGALYYLMEVNGEWVIVASEGWIT